VIIAPPVTLALLAQESIEESEESRDHLLYRPVIQR